MRVLPHLCFRTIEYELFFSVASAEYTHCKCCLCASNIKRTWHEHTKMHVSEEIQARIFERSHSKTHAYTHTPSRVRCVCVCVFFTPISFKEESLRTKKNRTNTHEKNMNKKKEKFKIEQNK